MNLVKRGVLSVIRKPMKSLLLAAILYLISILLLFAAGISQQQIQVQRQMRSQIGGSLRLEVDRNAGFERLIPYMQEVFIEERQAITAYVDFEAAYPYNSISMEDIQTIGKLEGVSSYNVIAFPPLQTRPVDFENDSSQVQGRPQTIDEFVTLQPVWDLNLINEALRGFIRLEDGRFLGPDDKGAGQLSIVISSDIAEANGLGIGDLLTFEWFDQEADSVLEQIRAVRLEDIQKEAEIIGIFEVSRSVNASNNSRTLENTIFAPFDLQERFFEGTDYLKRPREIGAGERPEATFFVDDMDGYDEIREQILALGLDWNRYNLIDANDMMASMGAGFKGLEQIGSLMFGIIFAAGFAMLLLIFALWVRNRSHEVAIFLAVGIEKKGIIGQFIFEAFLVGAISFALAALSLPLAESFIDIGRLNNQFQTQEILDWEDGHQSQVNHDSFFDSTSEMMRDEMSEMAVSGVSMTIRMVGRVAGAVALLIFSSILISLLPIIRKKPKKLLSQL